MQPMRSAGLNGSMRKQTVLGRGAMITLSALFLLGTVCAPVAAQPASKALATPVPTPTLPPPALAAFARAWDGVTAYSATVTVFEQLATVTVFEQQGADVQNIVFDYTFWKPASFTVRGLSRVPMRA